MVYFNIIEIKPSLEKEGNETVCLGWWPIVSMSISIASILISFLYTSKLFHQGWHIKAVILTAAFVFRMVAWQVLIILLADKSFLVFAAMVVLNYVVLFAFQKPQNNFEPLSSAILSFVLPIQILEQQVGLYILSLGNLLLMTSLTLAWSLELDDSWKPDLSKSEVVSEAWIGVVYCSTIPMFLAATVPLTLLVFIPR